MDKKSLIVVIFCVILLIAWGPISHMLFPPVPVEPSRLTTQEMADNDVSSVDNSPLPGQTTDTNVAPTTGKPASPKTWQATKSSPLTQTTPPAQDKDQEALTPKISIIENSQLKMELSNIGGGIQRFVLKEHTVHHLVDDLEDPVVINGQYEDEQGFQIPAFALFGVGDLAANTVFSVTDASDQIVYEAVSPAGVKVRKTFHLARENDYNPILIIEIENGSKLPINLKDALMSIGTMGPVTPKESNHYLGFDLYEKDKVKRKHYSDLSKKPFEVSEPIQWVSIKNQFFTLIVQPFQIPASGFYAESISTQDNPHEFAALLGMGSVSIQPGQSINLEYKIYAGPKDFNRLRELGDDKDQVMAFDVFMGMSLKLFGYITQMLLSVLITINGYVHNFGVSIVIITVIIKLIFWPLTAHATNSMKKMAALQPRMTVIRDKYKENPQKLQQEMMRLYREYKVNPFSGCLPGILQLPIFLAFYSMLQSAIELRGAKFLWIKDLSQPDTIFYLFGVSWMPVNPMPLIMAATMFFQMRMTPTTGDPMQKRIFMLMPVIFLVFCYNFSSGLSLYWTVQNLLTILQTWLSLRKKDPILERIKSEK